LREPWVDRPMREGRRAMTIEGRSTLAELMARIVGRETETVREAARLIAELRRDISVADAALSVCLDDLALMKSREAAYVEILHELRFLAQRSGWDSIVESIDRLFEQQDERGAN